MFDGGPRRNAYRPRPPPRWMRGVGELQGVACLELALDIGQCEHTDRAASPMTPVQDRIVCENRSGARR